MSLEFREYFKNGKATCFEQKICKGLLKNAASYDVNPKIHTVRKESIHNEGDLMDLVMNDKVFVVVRCRRKQSITIHHHYELHEVYIDGRELSEKEIETFAMNDGFDSVKEFFEYFDSYPTYQGVLIHWTDFKY